MINPSRTHTHVGKDVARQVANVVLVPLGIALNYIPIASGNTPATVSRAHEPMLAAAGWAFAIWGLLFVAQIAYAVYQALPSHRSDDVLRRIGWLTALNGVLAGLWTIVFCQELLTLSWLMMLGLLANLVAIDIRLRDDARHGASLWLVRITFGANLGWITVATLLDTSLFLYDVVGWKGAPLGPIVWSQIVVVLALLLASVLVVARRNYAFGLVVAWGLAAIGAYRMGVDRALGITAWGAALAIVLVVMARAITSSYRRVTA
ncbi:MAG: hypothetical protein ABI321_20505 [Polyangia bacterium]